MQVALDRQLYLRQLIEGALYGEPELRGDWRLGLEVPWPLATDAKSFYNNMINASSMPAARQTRIDLLVARGPIEQDAIEPKHLPNGHILAGVLTKAAQSNSTREPFLLSGWLSMAPTEDQQADEQRRLPPRQGQQSRAEEGRRAQQAPLRELAKRTDGPARRAAWAP